MANITLNLVLGDDQEVYANFLASLPAGENNLARGIVVPAHSPNQPQTFQVGGLTPNVSYVMDVEGEWQTPPQPRKYFVPIGTTHNITIALPYGAVSVIIHAPSLKEENRFILSVVNYATLFRAYAREVTEYSKLPLKQLEEAIASPLSFRLATPMLSGLTSLIPADLEILASLAHKLLVKNLLHKCGTLGATTEILAAFSASNPVFFQMKNINKMDAPLFRSEEVFQGYEAHIWLPNKEIERWQAFIQLLNNLPQIYTLKQITEQEVYVQQGGKLRRHLFDFSSPAANSITAGLSYLTDCFLRLFSLSVAVESEHELAFCQASYVLDQFIQNSLIPTDADPLAITPWSKFSLSGRFGQQFDIMPNVHEWYYDSPLRGEVDGVNRYFALTHLPKSTSAVKVFVDGLLKRLYVDYRISLSGTITSSAYRVLSMPDGNLLVKVSLGLPRPFLSPVFSTIECRENAKLQMLLTGVEQGLENVSFVISHAPNTAEHDPQSISIHFASPKTYNSGSSGDNQWGQEPLTLGINSYDLTYTIPTASIDYQLLVSLTVDPMPSGDPAQVTQVMHIVRERTQSGASIEFSAPIPDNTTLNWWIIEEDSIVLERGTFLLTDGQISQQLLFANGPYFDQVVIICQIWETQPTFIDAGIYLVSTSAIGPGGTVFNFSAPIVGNNYRLDYVVFPARDGDFIEFFEPPSGLIEAHYDVQWSYWINASLSPEPDGIRTTFSLPYPVTDPKSIYLALNGRLMTQGANHQYIVNDNNTVTFMFAPTSSQKPWVVYPVSSNSMELPSTWDQGFLNYLPSTSGEYATGWIKISNPILVGSTVSLDNLVFEAVATAHGLITNSTMITLGSSITWGTLGVTLTGVAGEPTSVHQFQVGVSKDNDTQSLITTINNHPTLNSHYFAESGGSGFTVVKAKKLGGSRYNETLSAFGSISATNIAGDSSPSSYNSRLIYYGEHDVSVSADNIDIGTSRFYHSEHPFYEGLGVKVTTTGTLPSPLTLGTLYYVTDVTFDTFKLSLTPYGTPLVLSTAGSGVHTFISQDIEVETSTFCFPTSSYLFTGTTTLNSPVVTNLLPLTADLKIGMSISGANIPTGSYIISIDSSNQITLNTNALATGTDNLTIENTFRDKEPVGFLTKGTLPSGLVEGQKYYAINITQNRFQVSETETGTAVILSDTGSDFLIVYSIPRFVAGNSLSLDSQALATELLTHPITKAKIQASVNNGLITLTAKDIGTKGNMQLAVSDPLITYQSLTAGKDPLATMYGSSKLCYYYDAPVLTLDGLSNRSWVQYGGDKFKFTYTPTLQQEGYYISEVFPIEYHPLDSTVANLPCNYPKGIFAQGFGTHHNNTEITVEQSGTLLISTANLPVQEKPQGDIDGVNTEFILSLESCAGQNSLMVWVDGIFQPSDKYTYTDMGTFGKITFSTPPSIDQKDIWVWYLPYGTSCSDERVRALVGLIDGANQVFTVPDSPWVNAPALMVFLEGVFVLQDQDYSVITGNTQIQFLGTVAPAVGQSLWGHYNLGSIIPVDNWRQVYVGITDGVTQTFMIPHLLSSELPTSVDSVLVFLNGLNQGGHFTMEVDLGGNPTGNITFNTIPEANRRLEVAYIRN